MHSPSRLQLLGAPRFWFQGQQVDVVCDKPVLLLCYLAYRGDWVGREALAFLFWPDLEDEAARRNLRQLVHRAKSLAWTQALETQPQRLRFVVRTDVEAFRQAVAEGDWAGAVAAYGGPLLESVNATTVPGFEAWLALERENLHATWREAALLCASELSRSARHREAAKLLSSVWQTDRLDEEVLAAYAKSAYLAGEREPALNAFESFSQLLQEELGVAPLEATQALAEAIRRGEALNQETGPEPAVRLPPQATPFVGRGAELSDLGRLLARPECRFLTITGPGGTGKTRLALQLAAEALERYPHGAAFVPLAALDAPEAITFAVAEALGFAFYGARDPKAQLGDYLRDKALLLVVDNLEHLASGAALLLELLEHAPAVKVLATSRQQLDLPGVWTYRLDGMPYGEDAAGVQESEAGRLFLQAARRAEPRFVLLSEEEPYLLELCRLTEGLPLALELAAVWVRHLRLRELAEEIGYNLDVLAGEQGGMRAVLEHSWSLLSPKEQRVLAKLSVFRGGFTRAAAQQVAGASLYTLLSLVGKSLLAKARERFGMHELLRQYANEKLAALGEETETRARHAECFATFLAARESPLKGNKQQAALAEIAEEIDNVRAAYQEALEQERAADLAAMMEALANFCSIRSLFSEAEETFGRAAARLGQAPGIWIKLLAYRGEFLHRQGLNKEARDLLQGQLPAVRANGDHEGLAAVLYALGNASDALGDYGAAEACLQESLALYRTLDDTYRQAHVLDGLGNVAYHQGDYRRAEEAYRESLALQTYLGDTWGLALTLGNLGTVADHLGNYQEARAFHERSLALKEALGDRDGVANSLLNLGTVAYQQGDYQGASELFAKSLGRFREIGNRVKAAAALNNLAGIGFALGNFEATRASLEEALKLRRELGDKSGVARCLTNLGLAAKQLGDNAEARRLHQESLEIRREIGDRAGVAASLAGIGYAAIDLGAYDEARQALHESLRIAWELVAVPRVLDALDGLAKLATCEGESEAALLYLSAIMEHPASIEYTKKKAGELLAHLQRELPTEAVAALLERGKTLSLEAVVAELLSQDVAPYAPLTTP